MTVSDLIEELKKHDQSLRVCVPWNDWPLIGLCSPITEVILDEKFGWGEPNEKVISFKHEGEK